MDPRTREKYAGRRRERRIGGRQWARFAKYVVDYYGGLCFCGHGGARTADHVIADTERPDREWRIEDFRPAHGTPGNPCPVCSRECGQNIWCNQLKGSGSVERALRVIAEKKAAHQGGKTPPEREKPGIRPQPDPGRAW